MYDLSTKMYLPGGGTPWGIGSPGGGIEQSTGGMCGGGNVVGGMPGGGINFLGVLKTDLTGL